MDPMFPGIHHLWYTGSDLIRSPNLVWQLKHPDSHINNSADQLVQMTKYLYEKYIIYERQTTLEWDEISQLFKYNGSESFN